MLGIASGKKSAALLLAALGVVACEAKAAPLAYVANGSAESVSVIDTASDTVVGAPIAVGIRPSWIVSNPAGSRIYVANAFSDSISVIDAATATVVATIDGVPTVDGMVLDPAGSRLVVATDLDVREIDTATNTVIGDPIPVTAPGSLCMYPVGPIAADAAFLRLYVPVTYCNGGTLGSLTVVDLASRSVLATFDVGDYPQAVAVSPDGMRAYVSNWYSDTVAVVDTAALAVASTIVLPRHSYPVGLATDPRGSRLYVVEEGPDLLVTFDAATLEVVGDALALGVDPGPIGLSADGTNAYVANMTDDTVSHVDLVAGSVVATIPTGDFPVAAIVAGQDAIFADGFDAAR